MEPTDALKAEVKSLIITNLMLKVSAEEIADDLPLFGPGGLGLDSVDALQMVVALEKQYGLKIPNPATAREILANVKSIAVAVAERQAVAAKAPASPGVS